jgi:phospho-N-acetylmuramoyl-pentapeptide-transferase
VNLTDGLDGLAAGSSIMVFGAYVAIGFWQFRNSCVLQPGAAQCYTAATRWTSRWSPRRRWGACFGFLWWNASPAKIFMGDTGSLAIGGAFAGIAIVTQTELLLIVLGGLFVIETLSVISRSASSRPPASGCSTWRRSTTTSSWPAGSRTPSSCASGSSPGWPSPSGLGVFYAEYLVHRPAALIYDGPARSSSPAPG